MVSDITKRALLLIAGNQSETRKSASSADLKSIMNKKTIAKVGIYSIDHVKRIIRKV